MTPDEQALADEFYEAIQHQSNYSERSQQSADFRIGMSDLGWCSELTRRMLAGIAEPITDKLDAFIGTALGDHVEAAYAARYGTRAVRHAEVRITLRGEHGEYEVGGHPDLLLLDENCVVDVKSTRGLSVVERTGPSQQQQFQRHGYALGAWEAGYFTGPLSEVQVANVWLDRAGDDERVHVQMEPYDPEVIQAAGEWLDEVVYAYMNGETARKEPPRDMCAKVCGHFADCRAFDTDVQGLITDDVVLAAVDVYREGQQMESEGRKLKDQARAHLSGRSGSTGTHFLRWTWVNDSLVPEYQRRGHWKIDLRPIK